MDTSPNPYEPPRSEISQEQRKERIKQPFSVFVGTTLIFGMLLYQLAVTISMFFKTWNFPNSWKNILAATLTVIIFFILQSSVCYFISKGKNWARIVFLVIFSCNFLYTLNTCYQYMKFGGDWTTSATLVLPNLISLTGVIFLFIPISNEYFRYLSPKKINTEKKHLKNEDLPASPTSIKTGIALAATSFVSSFVLLFCFLDTVITIQEQRGIHLNEQDASTLQITLVVFNFIFLLTNITLSNFIIRGKSWARVLMLVFFTICFFAGLPRLIDTFEVSLTWAILSSVTNALFIIGLVFLFLPASNLWLTNIKQSYLKRPVHE